MPSEASAGLDAPRTGTAATPWSALVLSSRERCSALEQNLAAILAAAPGPGLVDLVVNGNSGLSAQVAEVLRSESLAAYAAAPVTVRLWSVALGDKSNAFNDWLHAIRPESPYHFIVDGYVIVDRHALRALVAALEANPEALAASGMPSQGFSAARLRRQMLAEGGLHGNLFAVRGQAVRQMKEVGFRLPVGLYRFDSTLGAALSFGLDPSRNDWEPKRRIVSVDGCGWSTAREAASPVAAFRAWRGRKHRQAQGDFENKAVADLFARQRSRIDRLEADVTSLVRRWATARPDDLAAVLARGARWRAAWQRLLNRPPAPDHDRVARLTAMQVFGAQPLRSHP